jgi:hypothetical protein
MSRSKRGTTVSRRDTIRLLAATMAIATGAVAASAGGPMQGAEAAHCEKGLPNMTHDLAKLTAEHFEPLIGETFTVGQYRLILRDVHRRRKIGSRFRDQFAIVFKVPSGLPLRSEVLPVAHPAIGRYDLLVTQVIDETDGTALEICFS